MASKSEFIITFSAKDKNLFKGFKQIGEEAIKAKEALKKTGTEADKAGTKLEEAGTKGKVAGDKIASGANRAKGSLGGLRSAARLLTSQFSLLAGGVSAAFLVRGALRNASEFGIKLAEVGTIAGVTRGELVQLGTESRRIAASLGLPEVDAAAGLYQILSSGITDSADALVVLGASSQLAVAGVSSIREAADLLTSVLNAYNFSIDDSEKLTNQFFATVRLGKTTIPELAASIGKVAPIAANAGVAIEELQAAIASITLGGLSTPEAATQVRAVLVAFAKQKESIEAVFIGAGKSADDASIRIRGLQNVLQDLFEIVNSSGGGAEELFSILGRQEAGQAVVNLTGPNEARFDRVRTGVSAGEDTAISDAIRIQFEEPAQRLAAVFNSLSIAGSTAAGGFLEGLANVRAENADDFQTELAEMARVTDETKDALKSFGDFLRQAVGTFSFLFGRSAVDNARNQRVKQEEREAPLKREFARNNPVSRFNQGLTAEAKAFQVELDRFQLLSGNLSTGAQKQVEQQTKIVVRQERLISANTELDGKELEQAKANLDDARARIASIIAQEAARRQFFVDQTPEGAAANQRSAFDELTAEEDRQFAAAAAFEEEKALEARNKIVEAQKQSNALEEERLKILQSSTGNIKLQKEAIDDAFNKEIARLQRRRDLADLGPVEAIPGQDKGVQLKSEDARQTLAFALEQLEVERELAKLAIDQRATAKDLAATRKERQASAVALRADMQTLVALQKELGGSTKETEVKFAELRAAITEGVASGDFSLAQKARDELEILIPEAASYGSRFAKGFQQGVETSGDAFQQFGQGLSSALEGYISQIGRASGAWDVFKQQALAALGQIIAKIITNKIILSIFGPATNSFGFEGGGSPSIQNLTPSAPAFNGTGPLIGATGGVQSFALGGSTSFANSNTGAFAGGGIATSPVATIFGDQSAAFKGEAFIPIPADAKGIPVDFRGPPQQAPPAGGGPVQVNFNVSATDSKSFNERMAESSSRDTIVGLISDAMDRNTGFRQSVKGLAASA